MTYDPFNWYWLHSDGRIYASARQMIIKKSDADYKAWVADGNTATPWPCDESGEQTDAALQEVLEPYGLWVDLIKYASNRRWQIETSGLTIQGITVATDDRSKVMLLGARVKAASDPSYVERWKIADGQYIDLDAAKLIALSDAVQAHTSRCFAAEANIVDLIKSGEITTTQQIDDYDDWTGGSNG